MPSISGPVIGGALGAVGSLGGAAINAFNQPGSSPALGQATQLPNQAGEAANANQILQFMMGNVGNIPTQYIAPYQQYIDQIINNPYAAQAQQGANLAGAAAPGVAGMQLGGANALYGNAGNLLNAQNQLLGQAFDPESSLYNQLQQQNQQQTAANDAAAGVAGSPYGAGLANQSNQNFNINWQNNLLNRMVQGAQGAQTLNQGAGLDLTTASGLGTGGLNTLVSGYGAPYATSIGQANTAMQGLGTGIQGITGTYGLGQQTLNDILDYLQVGQGATGLALGAQNQAFGQNQVTGQNLSTALSNPALSNALSGLYGGGSPYTAAAGYYDPSAGYQPSSGYYGGDTGYQLAY